MFTAADASTACTDDGGAGVGAGCGDDTKDKEVYALMYMYQAIPGDKGSSCFLCNRELQQKQQQKQQQNEQQQH